MVNVLEISKCFKIYSVIYYNFVHNNYALNKKMTRLQESARAQMEFSQFHMLVLDWILSTCMKIIAGASS